ncbi:MAG: hypothetical protein HC915_05070 [Anaerolineae bacterium]|nr:hypothetical protein [Anaerolineae bacterium]
MRVLRGLGGLGRRVTETDNIILLIIGILVGVLLTVGGPEAVPQLERGARCINLAHPSGGNNRSLLALAGEDQQNLVLDVSVSPNQVPIGEAVTVTLIFRNRDNGPVILYLPDEELVQRGSTAPGPSFGPIVEISVPRTPQVSYYGLPTSIQLPNSFPQEDLYLLRSHNECFMSYEITAADLAAQGITLPQEYGVRGIYRNLNQGTFPVLEEEEGVVPTATPAFRTQGVWAGGRIDSNETTLLLFNPTPTPLPAP